MISWALRRSFAKGKCLLKPNEISLSSLALAELLETAISKDACLRFQVKGFSMSPFIKDNDVVTISQFISHSANIGCIAAFTYPKTRRLIMHRIIGKSNGVYLIKGDRVFNPDGLISKENILGRVAKIERNNKSVYFGLGFERVVIAFLSRIRLLNLVFYIWRLFIIPVRRISK